MTRKQHIQLYKRFMGIVTIGQSPRFEQTKFGNEQQLWVGFFAQTKQHI